MSARGPYNPQVAPNGSLGAIIKARRLELGLTIADVQKLIHSGHTIISLVECGKRAPNKDMLRRLAIALDMAVPS